MTVVTKNGSMSDFTHPKNNAQLRLAVAGGVFIMMFMSMYSEIKGMEAVLAASTIGRGSDSFVPSRRAASVVEAGEYGPREGYSLAYHESYGYFNDISDTTWEMSKDWAQGFKQHAHNKEKFAFYRGPRAWYNYHYDAYFSCPEAKRVGGVGDGPKWTCDIHRIKGIGERRWEQAQKASGKKEPYDANKYGCLVYSIGSNGDYTFEEAVLKHMGGPSCEIHIFDPTGEYARPENAEKNMHFHHWGLMGSKQNKTKDMYDIFEIMKKLGHEDRVIDIFKIDCEGCEWESSKDFVPMQNLRQILLETHGLLETVEETVAFYDRFAANNLVIFSKEANIESNGCLEYSFLRLHPDFLNR